MKKKLLSLMLVLGLLSAMLTGCGAEPRSADQSMAKAEMSAPMEVGGLRDNGADASTALPESRKWIVTVHMNAETDDLDAMTQALNEKITALGGYVEDQRIYNGSPREERRYRSASLTIRIPAENVDSFTGEIEGISNVVSNEKSLEDVTLSYVATESRMNALQTEEARLLELLAQAETMSDLLEIEARLTDVRYELESVTSQLRLYDNQIDYATVYLELEQVREYTPVEEPSVWQRISGGFVGSLKGLGNGIVDVLVWILASSPYLVVFGGIITGVVMIVKRARKKKQAKQKN